MNRDETEINVMIVEADKHPYMARIPDTVESKMEIVGGVVERVNLEEIEDHGHSYQDGTFNEFT